MGYTTPDGWLKSFDAALADPTSIEDKKQRYAAQPTETLAAAMGRIYGSLQQRKDSIAAWQQAMKLAGKPRADYAAAAFFQQMPGLAAGESTVADLKTSADAVLSSEGEPASKLLVTLALADLASERKEPALVEPYLQRALKESEGLTDERSKRFRSELLVHEALIVRKDPDLALQLKKAAMPEGWESSAGDLNAFAWWCFQNKLNLPEAEILARKAVDMAEPGKEKAQILDTVAEICNERGDCSDAAELSRRAALEDPSDEHYKKQVARFEELIARKGTTTGA